MKNHNFIVRLTIFFCTLYFVYVIYKAWDGVQVFDDTYKFLLEYCLYVFARDNPNYHCRYARFLALSVFVTDTITYIDQNVILIFPNSELMLWCLSALWSISIVSTIYLAVKHFMRATKINKKKRNKYGTE